MEVNRLLETRDLREALPVTLARRAGGLRHCAERALAVHAVVVGSGDPGGVVRCGDNEDLGALASQSDAVRIEQI